MLGMSQKPALLQAAFQHRELIGDQSDAPVDGDLARCITAHAVEHLLRQEYRAFHPSVRSARDGMIECRGAKAVDKLVALRFCCESTQSDGSPSDWPVVLNTTG